MNERGGVKFYVGLNLSFSKVEEMFLKEDEGLRKRNG
jgi:hypothetical protein